VSLSICAVVACTRLRHGCGDDRMDQPPLFPVAEQKDPGLSQTPRIRAQSGDRAETAASLNSLEIGVPERDTKNSLISSSQSRQWVQVDGNIWRGIRARSPLPCCTGRRRYAPSLRSGNPLRTARAQAPQPWGQDPHPESHWPGGMWVLHTGCPSGAGHRLVCTEAHRYLFPAGGHSGLCSALTRFTYQHGSLGTNEDADNAPTWRANSRISAAPLPGHPVGKYGWPPSRSRQVSL
jgi:hypothetical protein